MAKPNIHLRIAAVRRLMLAALTRQLKPLSMSPQQFIVLRMLKEGEVQPSAIAQRLVLDRPAVSRLLHRMRQDGWIISRRSRDDARRDVVELTPAGLAVFTRAERVWDRFRRQIEEPFSQKEIAELDRLLMKLETVVSKEL